MIADPKSLADSIDTEHINTMCTRTEGSLKRPATIDLSELRFWRERVLVLRWPTNWRTSTCVHKAARVIRA